MSTYTRFLFPFTLQDDFGATLVILEPRSTAFLHDRGTELSYRINSQVIRKRKVSSLSSLIQFLFPENQTTYCGSSFAPS
jgi:hypothetical protein